MTRPDTSRLRADDLMLRDVHLWSQEVESLHHSSSLLSRQGVLWALAISGLALLSIVIQSVLIGDGGSRAPFLSNWFRFVAGMLSLMLFGWIWHKPAALTRTSLAALVGAFFLLDILGVWFNGLQAMLFIPVIVVMAHILLDVRTALWLVLLASLTALGVLLWQHPQTPMDALLRLGGAIFGVPVVMQMLTRHWRRFIESTYHIGQDLERLLRNLEEEIASTEAQTQHIRRTDPKTGLLNRLGLEEWLQSRLTERGTSGCLILLRLELWESSVLRLSLPQRRALLERLISTLRDAFSRFPEDSIQFARTGHSEFGIVWQAPMASGMEFPWAVLDVLLARLKPPVTLVSSVTALTQPRIGVVCWPQDGSTFQQLISRAQWALEASGRGRATKPIRFEPDMEQWGLERLRLSEEIVQAIDNDEFEVLYRPYVRGDGQFTAQAEALLVWNHPRRGRLEPRTFMPFKEPPEQVDRVTQWKLEQAVRQIQDWRNRLRADVEISVNVPIGWVLRCAGKAEPLAHWIASLKCPAGAVVLEVSEDALLRDPVAAAEGLHLLKQHGFDIAMDHFGAGYSGLGQLHRLPLSRLKIGRETIEGIDADPQRRIVCSTVVQIGHAMGLQVSAEGVQTPAQQQCLAEMGCDRLQGPLFGPALSAEDFAALLV